VQVADTVAVAIAIADSAPPIHSEATALPIIQEATNPLAITTMVDTEAEASVEAITVEINSCELVPVTRATKTSAFVTTTAMEAVAVSQQASASVVAEDSTHVPTGFKRRTVLSISGLTPILTASPMPSTACTAVTLAEAMADTVGATAV
jgi:hypothetical protein